MTGEINRTPRQDTIRKRRGTVKRQRRNIRLTTTEGTYYVSGSRMTGPTPDPVTPLNRVTENNDNQNNSPSLQDQILSHISSLETLIKQHIERAGTLITPIRLTFDGEEESNKGEDNNKGPGKEKDEDLKRSYKEVLKSPFTRRVIEFSAPNHQMPTNLKIYLREICFEKEMQ
ncbi:hypothetical protein Tco_0670405 [Tanacetum coccineum]